MRWTVVVANSIESIPLKKHLAGSQLLNLDPRQASGDILLAGFHRIVIG
jgi:hypothetical protein